jgi:hypothetical protein
LLFSRDHVREKQRKLLGGGAITDGTTDAKNASVDGPLDSFTLLSQNLSFSQLKKRVFIRLLVSRKSEPPRIRPKVKNYKPFNFSNVTTGTGYHAISQLVVWQFVN